MRKGLLVLLIAIVITGRVNAQEERKCIAEDTMESCFGKLETWPADVNTGVSGLLTPAQSSTKDFLSLLTAAFAAPMSGEGPRPVSLAWNGRIPLGSEKHYFNLQAVFAKPEMSGDLKQRLGTNAAAITMVNDSLSELDDLTVRASFGPSTKRFGRSANHHRPAFNLLTDRLPMPVDQVATQFARLLNNQPQIYGEVKYRAMKNVAGPDERGVRLTYEMGFDNLNDVYGECDRAKTAEECTTALTALTKTPADAPEDRVAFSLEYRQWSALSVVVPDLAHFTAPRARSLVYSITYGRNHMMIDKGRLDVEVNYEDTTARTVTDVTPPAGTVTGTGAAAVRDRFVASATYTYQINGMMAMPLTLTYANHAAYLGDVERKLNAHFGLSFKMPMRP